MLDKFLNKVNSQTIENNTVNQKVAAYNQEVLNNQKPVETLNVTPEFMGQYLQTLSQNNVGRFDNFQKPRTQFSNNKIDKFKKFDDFIKIRNNIAHNLSSILNIDVNTKESEVSIGDKIITWSQYKEQINEWCNLSFELANFILKLYSKLNDGKVHAHFMYCKTEGDCVIVQHNLIYPQIEGDYTSFFKTGFNMDLLDYLNDEIKFLKDKP